MIPYNQHSQISLLKSERIIIVLMGINQNQVMEQQSPSDQYPKI